jgi:serine/threonine protein kinase
VISIKLKEMATGKALFPGHSTHDQLLKIFRILGTPSYQSHPDMLNLPEWDTQFPVYKGKNIKNIIQGLPKEGYELINLFLQYDPCKRITAKDALNHKYFEAIINK